MAIEEAKVLRAGDRPIVRDGLKALVERCDDLCASGEAEDANEA